MAERWQQWMPHDIDSWQGSANVQALSDLAYRAVHNLILDMWKQSDCALPLEDRELAKRSRVMGRWAECRDEVLEYFIDRTAEGKITHRVTFKKWNDAREVYEKRQKAAQKTNASRSGNGDRYVDREPSAALNQRPADTGTSTSTGTSTGTKTNTLASTAVAVPAARGRLVCTLPLNAGEHEVFDTDMQQWVALYPAVDVRQELRNLKGWLLGSPQRRKTKTGIGRFINSWMARQQNVSRPGGGNGNRHGKTAGNIDALAEAERFARERYPQDADEAGGEEAGPGDAGYASDLLPRPGGVLLEGN